MQGILGSRLIDHRISELRELGWHQSLRLDIPETPAPLPLNDGLL